MLNKLYSEGWLLINRLFVKKKRVYLKQTCFPRHFRAAVLWDIQQLYYVFSLFLYSFGSLYIICIIWDLRFVENIENKNQSPEINFVAIRNTAWDAVISPVWKFCGKAQFPHSFGQIAQNYTQSVSLQKISTLGN